MGSRKTVKVSAAPRASAMSRKHRARTTKARRGVYWSGGSGDGVGCALIEPWLSHSRAVRYAPRRSPSSPPLAFETAAHAGAAERGAPARRDRLDAGTHLV